MRFFLTQIAPKIRLNLIFFLKNLDQNPPESISLLRGVIHECHRFLKVYQDPSVLYTTPGAEKSVPITPPPGRRMMEEWFTERPLYPPPNAEKLPHIITHPAQEKVKKWCVPRVFISIYYVSYHIASHLANVKTFRPRSTRSSERRSSFLETLSSKNHRWHSKVNQSFPPRTGFPLSMSLRPARTYPYARADAGVRAHPRTGAWRPSGVAHW